MSALAEFPESSYLRVFHAPRQLTPREVEEARRHMQGFLAEWESHETPVAGYCEVVHDRFLVVAANESRAPISGCSKDTLTGAVRALGQELGLDLMTAPPLCYRDGDAIRCVTRAEFGELVEKGEITKDTVVFDSTILSVGPYVAGRWEVPAGDCWHARAYELV